MTSNSPKPNTILKELAQPLSPQQMRTARRAAVQYAYAIDIHQQTLFNEMDFNNFVTQVSLDRSLAPYVKNICVQIIENWIYINKLIEKHAHNWKISRIAKVDLGVLRVCSIELIDRSDLVREIILADAAEMGKENNGEGSGSFVHGVLDGIAKEVRGLADNTEK